MASVGTVTSKGQITIPKEIRDILGLINGDKVAFLADGDHVIMRKVDEVKLSTILSRQKPWGSSGIEYQRRIRAEWPQK